MRLTSASHPSVIVDSGDPVQHLFARRTVFPDPSHAPPLSGGHYSCVRGAGIGAEASLAVMVRSQASACGAIQG